MDFDALTKGNDVTPNEFIAIVQGEVKKIDSVKLYYTLKKLGVNVWVSGNSFKIMKIILVLYKVGFKEFGASMVAELAELKNPESCWLNLHMLGDNHILTKLRGVDLTKSTWKLSQLFLTEWEGTQRPT